MAANERFLWATDLLSVQPTNNVLEIGCGAGIFAEQIAGKLETGKLIAVDKSAAMITMAIKRNQKFIEQGKVSFSVSDFAKSNFGDAAFDKITAFNVNVFWKEPSKELALIRKHLKPNGNLYLFYQPPYEASRNDAMPTVKQLDKNDFSVQDILFKKMKPASSFCIIAMPSNF